jgi:hypothetical protein
MIDERLPPGGQIVWFAHARALRLNCRRRRYIFASVLTFPHADRTHL